MDFLQIIALAVVQGVTEFLPVGSEAHLMLAGKLFSIDQTDAGIAIPLHIGAVLAVIAYFHSEMGSAVMGLFQTLRGRPSAHTRLAGKLLMGSLPWLVIAGALVALGYTPSPGTLLLLAWMMLGIGLLMLVTDRIGMTVRRVEHMGAGTALLFGLVQAVALIPGAGRLAMTMTVARLLGFERRDAARYAMLIGILPMLALTGWHSWGQLHTGEWTVGVVGAVGGGAAFIAAYAAIAFLMSWLRRGTLLPFALYRVILGGALLYSLYT